MASSEGSNLTTIEVYPSACKHLEIIQALCRPWPRFRSYKTTRMLRLYVGRQSICGKAGCSYAAKG